ncbi:MAG TPA: hypothetical protein VGE69_00955 [Pseudomonadales bacterium]
MKIAISAFKGMVPSIDAPLLPLQHAVDAVNVKLWSGTLKPFREPAFVATPTKVGTKKTIYRFAPTPGNDASGYIFHWTDVVDVVRGPVRGDTSERTYYTGDGVPKVTDNSIALSGGTNYPMNSYTLGIPAPADTPTVTLGGTAEEDATEADQRTWAYVYTYVSAWGEEGPPSTASASIDVMPGESVTVSNLSGPPTGNYNIIAKRIYRTATDDATTEFYFLAELAVSTSSIEDSTPDTGLGERIPSETWYAPPTDMHSIGVLDNGIGYGASKNDVCVSEPYLLHAWNPLYRKPASHPVVGIGSFGNTIVALTEKNPVLISGTDSGSMSDRTLNINQGCVSKRSIVSGEFGVVYASPDGLVLIGGDMADVVTREFLTRDQWLAFKPSSIIGVLYNGMYMGFYDNGSEQGGFLFDPANAAAGFIYLDIFPSAVYADPLSDKLYLCIDGDVVAWDAGDPLEYAWKSKEFVSPRPSNFTAARVTAKDYDSLTLKAYVGGVLTHTQAITDAEPFRLPFKPDRRFQFILSGTSEVELVEIAESVQEIVDGG